MVNYQHENVHYSVPDSSLWKKVHVKVYSEKIVILYGKEKVASSTQLLRVGDCIKLEHYLRTLSRKRALPHLWFGKEHRRTEEGCMTSNFKGGQQDVCSVADHARKMDFPNGHCHGMQGADGRGVRKISPDQVKAMPHGSVQGDRRNHGTACSPAQQENIEREAVDMLEGITALMTGYNEVHDIIPTI